MRKVYIPFALITILLSLQTFGQFTPEEQKRLDSLGVIADNPNSLDTSLAKVYMQLSEMLYVSNNDTLIPLCEMAQEIAEKGLKNNPNEAEKKSFQSSLSHAYGNLGYIYNRHGKAKEALSFYEKAIKFQEELNDSAGIANTFNNVGFIHFQQGNISEALEQFHKSLEIKELLGDKRILASTYNNIGAIHRDQKNDSLALLYYKKSLKMRKATGNKRGIANSYNNIAVMMTDIAHGLDYHHRALQIRLEINDEPGIASSYNNIGNAHFQIGKHGIALEYFIKGLAVAEKINHTREVISSKKYIAEISYAQGNISKAKKYAKDGLELAQKSGRVRLIMDCSGILSKIYEETNKGMDAYKMHLLYTTMKDSIDSDAALKTSAQKQAKYEYKTQKALDDADHDKQLALESEAKEKQKILTIAIAIGLGLVVIFLIFVFNRLQVTKKQKLVIETQKGEVEEQKLLVEHQRDEVEEAHKEITDSINYAERIQRSFLATDDILNENLNEYFVFFQPKEAVSGDFYWAGKLPNNKFAMVNADSTGHGVPGAIMSILNISSIEQAVYKGLTTPHAIFNDTRKTIIDRLKKDGSEEGGKDGMDASIIAFDFDNNKFTYAAAQNPIWIIRNQEVIQIKPEKMPVGKHDHDSIPFVGGEFDTQKGDIIYTLTDGYQDQFGGPKGKKFMIKKMREYVLSISHLPMKEQHDKIKDTFNNWMGDLEQIDDVCVIGVRV